MNETITIQIPVQVEEHGDQLIRARPLGPWKLQVVGANWTEVERDLTRRLSRELPGTLPSDLFAGGLPSQYESGKISVELKPQDRDARWEIPLQVELDSFRWLLPQGNCVVRIPAVNCMLFGKCEELTELEVSKFARIALHRLAENRDLLALSQRFAHRRFSHRTLSLEMPIGTQPDQIDQEKQDRKATATLRAAASDLSRVKATAIYGLDEKAAELADYFHGDSPQSVLLVGPAGVGKTSLVFHLVKLSTQLGLAGRRFWSTSGARIVSGMAGLGMWQERCSKLVRQAHATRSILHLGSLYELMEAGKVDGQPGVASMVRQSIAAGKLLAVAECTPEQLAIIEREDPMLLRAFTKLEFKELSAAKIRAVLRAAADNEQAGQQVAFSDQALEELYRLHTRFATYSALPATALRLMRTVSDSMPAGTQVTAEDVARAFAAQTGLPPFLVDDSIAIDLPMISRELSRQVVGQAEPVEIIVNLLATLKARLVRPGRPLASLMFIGPTGVGKTEMAKAIARLLYSDASRMLRIDMSEYSSPWSTAKLIGKPGEGDGTLTSPIREQPFSVVLLDEFEKADPHVFDILLQVLGEGRLTDSHGRLADFRNAVVIMTSNLGAETYRDNGVGFGEGETANWREHFERELRSFVRPEFLGRLDRIVPFRPLAKDVVRQITVRELQKLRERPGLKYSDAELQFTDQAIDRLCHLGYQPKYGARPLRRAIELNVSVPLANALSERSKEHSWTFEVDVADDEICVRPQRRSTKTRGDKELEAEVIDGWQQLGMMARIARTSGPLRDLENELERTRRQSKVLEARLQTAAGPSRIAALQTQLQQAQAFVEISKRIRANLATVVDKICEQHLSLMTAWHRGDPVDWAYWQDLSQSELTELRQATEDMVRRRITSRDVLTLIVSGRGGAPLETLWSAYRQLAQENKWQWKGYVLCEYDPRKDIKSAAYRKQASEHKLNADSEAGTLPELRLQAVHDETIEAAETLADVYPHEGESFLSARRPQSCGFAVQVRGLGVESWLEGESGITHFYDSNATGSKRRQRFRILVFNEPLEQVRLPLDWQQPAAPTERDPRRTVDLSEQVIFSGEKLCVNFAQGKLAEAMVSSIRQEHEIALWQSIGFAGIPTHANLSSPDIDMEIPF